MISSPVPLKDVARVKPENTNLRCRIQHPIGYVCTRRKDHHGPHVAHGMSDEPVFAWPRAVRPKAKPQSPGS